MSDGQVVIDIAGDASRFNQALKSIATTTQSQISSLGGAFTSIGSKLTNYITKPAVGAATALAGITLAKGFSRLVAIDDARAKLMGLGNDAKAIDGIMSSALAAVKGTAFGMDEAATAAASAVAAGVQQGKDLTSYLTTVGNAAAAAGIEFADMGSIFGKVQTAGRAYTQELNQLGDAGIPIFQYLAKEAGKTTDEIRDMASKGEISSQMFLRAIQRNLGAAAGIASMTGKSIDEVNEALDAIEKDGVASLEELENMAADNIPVFEYLAKTMNLSAEEVKQLAADGQISAEQFREAIESGIGGAAKIIGQNSFTGALDNIWASVSRIGANFLDAGGKGGGFFSQLKPLMVEAMGYLENLEVHAADLGIKFGEAFANGVEKIREIVAWFKELSPAMQKAIPVIGGMAVLAGPTFLAMGKAMTVIGGGMKLIEAASAPLSKMTKATTDLFTGVGSAAVTFGKSLVGGALESAKTFASGVSTAFKLTAETANEQFGGIGTKIADKFGGIKDAVGNKLSGLGSAIADKFTGVKDAVLGKISGFMSPIAERFGSMKDTLVNKVSGIIGPVAEKFSGLKDAIGSKLSGLGGKLGSVFGTLKDSLGAAASDAVKSFTSKFDGIGEKIGGAFSKVGSAAGTLTKGLATATGVLGAVATGIMGLGIAAAMGGVDLEEMSGKVTSTINQITANLPQVAEQMSTMLPSLVNQVVASMPALIDAFMQAFSSIVGILPQIVPPLVSGIASLVSSLAQSLITMLPTLLDAGIQLFTALIQALDQIIPSIISALPGLIQQLATALITNLPTLLQAGLQLFMGIAQALVEAIPQIIEILPDLITQLISALVAFIPDLLNAAIELFMAIVEALPMIIDALVGAVPTVINSVVSTLPTLIPQLIDAAIKLFLAIVDALPKIIPSLVGAVPTVINAVINALPTLIPALLQGAVQLFTAIVQAVPQILGSLLEAVKSLITSGVNAVKGMASNMATAGLQLIQGLVNGIRDAAGQVIGAIGGVVTDAINGAKQLLGIASPSKVFKQIGKYVSQGLAQGIAGEASKVTSAMEKVLNDLTQAAESSARTIDSLQTKIANARKKKNNAAEVAKLTKQLNAAKKEQAAYNKAATESKKHITTLQKLASKAEIFTQKIKDQQKAVEAAQKEMADYAKEIKDTFSSFGALSDLPEKAFKSTDKIIKELNNRLATSKKFAADVQALAKKGLKQDAIDDIIGMGVEKGSELAKTLATATQAEIDQINKLQGQITKQGTTLGNSLSKQYYQAGVDAAKGLLKGLQTQKAALDKEMKKIADTLTKTIKNQLGIKSPSRVFMAIGRYISEGLGGGIADKAKIAIDSVKDMTADLIDAAKTDVPQIDIPVDFDLPAKDLSQLLSGFGFDAALKGSNHSAKVVTEIRNNAGDGNSKIIAAIEKVEKRLDEIDQALPRKIREGSPSSLALDINDREAGRIVRKYAPV